MCVFAVLFHFMVSADMNGQLSIYVYICVYMCIYVYVCVHMYMCMCICIFICVYTCICVCGQELLPRVHLSPVDEPDGVIVPALALPELAKVGRNESSKVRPSQGDAGVIGRIVRQRRTLCFRSQEVEEVKGVRTRGVGVGGTHRSYLDLCEVKRRGERQEKQELRQYGGRGVRGGGQRPSRQCSQHHRGPWEYLRRDLESVVAKADHGLFTDEGKRKERMCCACFRSQLLRDQPLLPGAAKKGMFKGEFVYLGSDVGQTLTNPRPLTHRSCRPTT